MSITKKDTIVLTVLFNIVVLACVLATARHLPSQSISHQVRQRDAVKAVVSPTVQKIETDEAVAFDEIDQLLEDYIATGAVQEAPVVKAEKNVKEKPLEGLPSDAFYVVKPGDNPWKIAKKFRLSFEKLLELNNLDEAKARNLKVGQTLKIRETP
jgi:LysM repeat protein